MSRPVYYRWITDGVTVRDAEIEMRLVCGFPLWKQAMVLYRYFCPSELKLNSNIASKQANAMKCNRSLLLRVNLLGRVVAIRVFITGALLARGVGGALHNRNAAVIVSRCLLRLWKRWSP